MPPFGRKNIPAAEGRHVGDEGAGVEYLSEMTRGERFHELRKLQRALPELKDELNAWRDMIITRVDEGGTVETMNMQTRLEGISSVLVANAFSRLTSIDDLPRTRDEFLPEEL